MADSLDDFFAKKDRSKKSKGKKVTLPIAPPEIAYDSDKFAEEETQNTVTPKEPVININIKLGDEVKYLFVIFIYELPIYLLFILLLQDDGEWKEFEVEKDYSGLKIQAMTIK